MRHKDASFTRGERLCGIKAVSELFSGGRTINMPPLRVIYRMMPADEAHEPVRVLVSVPKRNFRKAVERNLIRRRIKEAWRKNKMPLKEVVSASGQRIELAVIWNDTLIRPYDETEKSVKDVIGRLTRLKY
ncbi:MAG: ribonuclease P protein component [Bacteroidales bacterium]|nr:ribonuclease P protein component [Bacteroidales bacterium]